MGASASSTTRAAAGVDGLIIVDLPPEEDDELCLPARGRGLRFIRLATPTTDDGACPRCSSNASGFIYYVSITGITGTGAPVVEQVAAAVARLRRHTDCRSRSASASARPSRRARSPASPMPSVVGSALVDRIARVARRRRRAPAGPRREPCSTRCGELAAAVRDRPEGPRHELAHRLRPPQDQGAGAQQPAGGARRTSGSTARPASG